MIRYFDKELQQFKNLKKENQKFQAWYISLLEIGLASIIKLFLKRLQHEKTLNCVKSRKLVIAKIFVYILTRVYNNSEILKKEDLLEGNQLYNVSRKAQKMKICNYYK